MWFLGKFLGKFLADCLWLQIDAICDVVIAIREQAIWWRQMESRFNHSTALQYLIDEDTIPDEHHLSVK